MTIYSYANLTKGDKKFIDGFDYVQSFIYDNKENIIDVLAESFSEYSILSTLVYEIANSTLEELLRQLILLKQDLVISSVESYEEYNVAMQKLP